MKGSLAIREMVITTALLAAAAVVALAVYRATAGLRAAYPPAEVAEAIKALKPVAAPDYIPIYAVKVHYELSGGRYVLMPGPSPRSCGNCIPPVGWLYAVSFGANASPVYGVYYTAVNSTMYVGGAAVVAPYFGNATLYYLYPMCPGGYRLSERATNLDNTPISITIILINCS